jgi:hypothetical protein
VCWRCASLIKTSSIWRFCNPFFLLCYHIFPTAIFLNATWWYVKKRVMQIPFLDKIKQLKAGRKEKLPSRPFPTLKRDEFEKTLPIHEVAVHMAPSLEKKKLDFPEIKKPKKEESRKDELRPRDDLRLRADPRHDMNHLITKIVDDVHESTKDEPIKDAFELLSSPVDRHLFFEKVERMVKEGKISPEDMKRFSENDLFSTMKEHYEKNKKGEPYLFDYADFQEHFAMRVHHLKELELEWQKMADHLQEVQSKLDVKEREIGENVISLKSLLERYDDYEKHKLLQSKEAASAQSVVQSSLSTAPLTMPSSISVVQSAAESVGHTLHQSDVQTIQSIAQPESSLLENETRLENAAKLENETNSAVLTNNVDSSRGVASIGSGVGLVGSGLPSKNFQIGRAHV